MAIDAEREKYVKQLFRLEAEAEKSGKTHRRDLYRAIKRMKGELREYDAFRAQARSRKG